jgi:hypothetical protein
MNIRTNLEELKKELRLMYNLTGAKMTILQIVTLRISLHHYQLQMYMIGLNNQTNRLIT